MQPQRRTPIIEPSAWLAGALAVDTSWRYQLSGDDRRELLAATAQVRDAGHVVGRFGRHEFELPTVGKKIAAMADIVENGRGIALIQGVPITEVDPQSLPLMYWGIGSYAGQVISQNSKGQVLAEVSDRGNSYTNPNTRGFSTNAELLPHVDTSDMTMLLCIRQAKSGGLSRIVSSTAAYNSILEEHPEYLDVLYQGFYNDLRGEGPTGKIDELTHRPIPVYSYHAGRVSCSFNDRMIRNAAAKRGVPLKPLERHALEFLREVTMRESHGYRFMMQPGDIQMVSNHSVFHSRESFEDFDDPAQRRCLFRLWVNVHNGRPLADDFADRYNTGPRGGVAVGNGAEYQF